MKYFYPVILILVGFVHLIPSRILIQKNFIEKLYDLQDLNSSLNLIILHRAFFFLLVSILSFLSIFILEIKLFSFIYIQFSMISYIILFLILKPQNDSLKKVFQVDVVLVLLLAIGFYLDQIWLYNPIDTKLILWFFWLQIVEQPHQIQKPLLFQ